MRKQKPEARSQRLDELVPIAIELEIGELVLDGFGASDGTAIRNAVQRGLSRLLAANSVASRFLHENTIDKIDAGSISIDSRTKPETIGVRTARAVYEGLQQ